MACASRSIASSTALLPSASGAVASALLRVVGARRQRGRVSRGARPRGAAGPGAHARTQHALCKQQRHGGLVAALDGDVQRRTRSALKQRVHQPLSLVVQ
jgi:hypothetical protein